MKTWQTSLIVAVLCPGSVVGQHELMPEVGALGDVDSYDLKLREVFSEAYKPGVELRVVWPGDRLERVIFIDAQGNVVSLATTDFTVWSFEHRDLRRKGAIRSFKSNREVPATEETEEEKKIPALLSGIKLQRDSRPLPEELQIALKEVWKDAIMHVTYQQKSGAMLDGSTIHFSTLIQWVGYASGMTWFPKAGTRPDALCSIAGTLRLYASNGAEATDVTAKIEVYRKLTKNRIESGPRN